MFTPLLGIQSASKQEICGQSTAREWQGMCNLSVQLKDPFSYMWASALFRASLLYSSIFIKK